MVLLTLAVVICVARITKTTSLLEKKVEAYNQISSEFQQYKSKAVEKERKLSRELQDERNKLDEMKGHGNYSLSPLTPKNPLSHFSI